MTKTEWLVIYPHPATHDLVRASFDNHEQARHFFGLAKESGVQPGLWRREVSDLELTETGTVSRETED